ncbi:MAG: TrkH family potassium uptake protein [Rhodothermales bacterium]
MRSELWNPGMRRHDSIWRRLSPPQLFVGSFLLLIVLGVAALQGLPGVYAGERLSLLDALFTVTSAVCVTGLIVVDTATFFTPFGQGVILVLIQLGGLGIIAFTTVVLVALGRRLSLRHEQLAAGTLDVAPQVDYRQLVRSVIVFTVLIELVGGALLFLFWLPEMGAVDAWWPALFHSVSAFCNAGFSVFSDSLVGYQQAPFTQGVIMSLIVVGGIGFLTLEELMLYRKSGRRFRMTLHSRMVLTMTGLLIGGGWVFFTLFEWDNTLTDLPAWARVLNGLFISVTARTAGFNTIDYAQASDSTNFLTMILMSIGGSPGSTAGGLKTTTVALIALQAWSRLRGREVVSIWDRSIPPETTQRAVGLFALSAVIITATIFVFTSTETTDARLHQGFLHYAFETVSAFNTVGLSMGVTDDLTVTGRLTIITLMFVGRVGLLTVAASLARRALEPVGGFRYAYEEVLVG